MGSAANIQTSILHRSTVASSPLGEDKDKVRDAYNHNGNHDHQMISALLSIEIVFSALA